MGWDGIRWGYNFTGSDGMGSGKGLNLEEDQRIRTELNQVNQDQPQSTHPPRSTQPDPPSWNDLPTYPAGFCYLGKVPNLRKVPNPEKTCGPEKVPNPRKILVLENS